MNLKINHQYENQVVMKYYLSILLWLVLLSACNAPTKNQEQEEFTSISIERYKDQLQGFWLGHALQLDRAGNRNGQNW
jgi:hypothetical protein